MTTQTREQPNTPESGVANGGPAFPIYPRVQGMQTKELSDMVGMSLRDYFAAKALAHPYAQGDDTHMNCDKAAAWAYELADAMLKARNA
jgi:hypothetical protein